MSIDMKFYNGKKVLVTGHTGFKGTWLCKLLLNSGAKVVGYSLEPPTTPNLYHLSGIENNIHSYIADIRDYNNLKTVFDKEQPEIVFHLAAQPIVRESYKNPRYTYETNVMGTVNVLECIRNCCCVKSALIVTTDKVYKNNEWLWGYREEDPLDGFDPYSNSKSCSELVTHSYIRSFFAESHIAISTVRAGNVIGGGDFANDRIIPDCIRAVQKSKPIGVRNPYSTRPYQHVLEPLSVYLIIAARQYENIKLKGFYNVGPDECDCITTGELVEMFVRIWGEDACWENQSVENAPHEASFLKLDCSKIKAVFGWSPRWHIEESLKATVEFSKIWLKGGCVSSEMDREIEEFYYEHMVK